MTVVNKATGLSRATVSNESGLATITALPLTGTYSVNVTKPGFTAEEVADLALRAGETASVKVTLVASGGTTEVVVFGTTQGVRANAQIGERLQSETIDELPILGRKATTLPLFNSAFRQGKGTGDLFVNATYFITGGGSRRTTTYMLDGANNDEGWGRQTMIATVPIGAIEEISILSNAFSAEYGWTAGPALNIVTKSGTNAVHGEGLYLARPGGMQAKTFSTKNFCAPEVATCVTPTTLAAINPADTPDELNQFSMSMGAPIKKDRTFLYFSTDYTMQDRTTFLSPTLPSFVLPADGSLDYVGEYRQTLGNVRVDHKLTTSHTLMMRANWDKFHDTNPNDAVAGTSAPTVARKYSRGSVTGQVNLTSVLGPSLVNEGRVSYLHGDPVTLWEAQELSTTYTRAGSVPFTIGQSRVSDVFSHQWQFSDTLTWSKGTHNIRFGTNLVHHTVWRLRQRTRFRGARHVHVPGGIDGAVRSADAERRAAVHAADQLRRHDLRTRPVAADRLRAGQLARQRRPDARPRPALRPADADRCQRQLCAAHRLWLAPGRRREAGHSRRLRVVLHADPIERDFRIADRRPGWLHQLRGDARAVWISRRCLTGSCLPLQFDPKTLPASQLPARDITIRAGERDFYRQQFASYGLNFDLLPNYPDEFVNPRSQVISIGAEREMAKGLFVGGDYVNQQWTNLDRTVDLNAPSVFDRTAPGQTRAVAAANATRPILPVNGGVRAVNVLTNLGESDYNGLTTTASYRGNPKWYAGISYTLSKGTNTTEPDGNGIGPNQAALARLGEEERGPSVVDQRHRAVITFYYRLPFDDHGRHGDAAGVSASVQRGDRRGQQRRRRQQRSAGHRRPGRRQVGVSRHVDVGRVDLSREQDQGRLVRLAAAALRGFQSLQSRATSSAARRQPTVIRARRTRRSVRWSRSARRPTPSRRWPTSTRPACSSFRFGTCSKKGIIAG